MGAIRSLLSKQSFVVLDGGLATELERRGAVLDDPLWSAQVLLEDPRLIQEVHLEYLRAGAQIITTASYQATLPAFAARGVRQREAEQVMRSSVMLAREACERFADEAGALPATAPLVAASIGPFGAYLHDGSEYRGDYGKTVRELKAFHRPRLEILLAAQPDLLALETIPSRREAEALLELLEELGGTAWFAFACRDEERLGDGERFAAAVGDVSASERVLAAGVNCTAPRHISGLLRSIAGAARKPVVVYPNSGERWDAAAHCWRAGSKPDDSAAFVSEWHALGARLIGGCCRTTPETIAQIAAALRAGAEA
jgi:homocysteine S-methyltransferase